MELVLLNRITAMKNNKLYADLLRYAYKVTLRTDEAEDLLQTALLAAIEAGRADMTCINNRRWLIGAIRNRAAFDARSAVRRRAREATVSYLDNSQSGNSVSTTEFVRTLPPSLKTTALLALTGHTKAELAWLLRVSDPTLRQRIVQIKRRWRNFDGRHVSELSGLRDRLAFGQIRKALLKAPCHDNTVLARHDPDGRLFMVSSQNHPLRQHRVIPTHKEE